MRPMPLIRNWQMDAMQKNTQVIEHIVASISDPAVFEQRDGGDGWTIAEVLRHLAAVDAVFHERARLTAETDEPPVRFSDPAPLMESYAEQDALAALAQWKSNRAAYLECFRALPDDEAVWEHPAQQEGFSLNDQLILTAYHDVDHLHQIMKIIQNQP